MPPPPVLPLLIHTKANTEYLKGSYYDDISFITLFMHAKLYLHLYSPLAKNARYNFARARNFYNKQHDNQK